MKEQKMIKVRDVSMALFVLSGIILFLSALLFLKTPEAYRDRLEKLEKKYSSIKASTRGSEQRFNERMLLFSEQRLVKIQEELDEARLELYSLKSRIESED